MIASMFAARPHTPRSDRRGADPDPCAVCGARDAELHLEVERADAGSDELIPTTDRYGAALGDIVRCRRCGHMQLARQPAAERLAEAYTGAESADYIAEQRGQRATAAVTLAAIERHTRPGRILDLGCWVGFLLAEARERGWRPSGIEPSAFAAAWARDRLDLDVRTGELDSLDPADGPYDAIVMADVIEHLIAPGAALARIRPALAPTGVLALALPDAGSRLARAMGRRWWSVLPTHVQYFTRASLLRLLAAQGYEPLAVGTAPKAFTVRYYLGRIGGYSPPLSRALSDAAERAGLADRLWTPDFRDRMLVLARPGQAAAG
jgi:SAM-dependent methyltransferase